MSLWGLCLATVSLCVCECVSVCVCVCLSLLRLVTRTQAKQEDWMPSGASSVSGTDVKDEQAIAVVVVG